MLRAVPIAIAALAIAACAATNPFYDPAKPHHTPEGFRNNYPHPDKGSFWAWQWERWKNGRPRMPEDGWRFETARSNGAFLRANGRHTTLTWVGHSTFLVQIDGLNVITDPQFSVRASPVSFAGPYRVTPPVPSPDELPRIDVVLISHDHYDHLDVDSVLRLAGQSGGSPRFFVGLGLKRWFAELGIENVVELDWWQRVEHRGLELHFVPVQHWSKRTLFDTNERLWGGWVLRHPALSFFFAGDAGYSKDFADIGQRFGHFDLAAFPIGSYAPRWFMKVMHVNPEEAVLAHRDVRARQSVAMHWGTFAWLSDEDLDEPPKNLAAAREKHGLPAEAFFVMQHGETRTLTFR